MTIISADNGRKFGGYTSVSWSMGGGCVNDPAAFLFSLDMKTQFKPREPSCSVVRGDSGHGVQFGGETISQEGQGASQYWSIMGTSPYYIPADATGGSLLVGYKASPGSWIKFTAKEVEVW